MTSNLSSAKQFRTSFLQTLKQYCFYGIGLFAVLLPCFADIHYMFQQKTYYLHGLSDYDYLADYNFALARFGDNEEFALVCIAVGLCGMFLALNCWRFLHVKKTVNVYFTLGISRADLFWSRFLACVLLLTVPVLLIFAGLAVCNLFLFGSSAELWMATGIYGVTVVAVGLFAFAMVTLCMVVSGASIESFLCGGCLIAMPVTLFFAIKYFAMLFLNGSAYDHRMYSVLTGDSVSDGAFGGKAAVFNFFYPVYNYDFVDGLRYNKADAAWSNPGVSYALVWIAAAAVVALIAYVCFVRRKNENAGFLGKNAGMIAASCLSLAWLLAIPAYYLFENYYGVNGVIMLIGVALMLLVYTIVMSVLLRSRQKLTRAMPAILIACVVFALTGVLFANDLFGFEMRIPAKEDIASVSITAGRFEQAVEGNGFSFEQNYYSEWYAEDESVATPEYFAAEHMEYSYYNNSFVLDNLTSEQDVDTVLQIHTLLANATREEQTAFSNAVALQYTLKNGKKITRYYEYATPEVMQLLQSYEQHTDVLAAAEKRIRDTWIDTVSLFAPAASQITILPQEMADNIVYELQDALIKDLHDGTLPVTTYGNTAPVGYVSFASNLNVYTDTMYYYEDNMYATTAVYYEDMAVHATTAHYDKELGTPVFEEIAVYTLAGLNNDFDYFHAYHIYPVYADMQATVAVLTEYELLQYFTVPAVPVRAKLMEIPFDGNTTRGQTTAPTARTAYFHASYATADDRSLVETLPVGAVTEDADVLAQLTKDSFLRHDISAGGYFAALEYADGSSVLVYLPTQSVPENLR